MEKAGPQLSAEGVQRAFSPSKNQAPLWFATKWHQTNPNSLLILPFSLSHELGCDAFRGSSEVPGVLTQTHLPAGLVGADSS